MSGMRRPVAVIIGMMGAGKTRVGKEVAQMMNLPFADADNEIEHDAGMRIPEYFEKYGEPEFRRLESDVVLDMLEDFDGIFSLGGGAPMTPSIQEGLAQYIADGGKVVYLMADPEEAMERANRGGGRPMLNGDANERWKKLYKERDPVFRSVANVHVGTRGQSPQAAARKLMEMIDQRIVHVTGSTIEPYDVRIGEGMMGQRPMAGRPQNGMAGQRPMMNQPGMNQRPMAGRPQSGMTQRPMMGQMNSVGRMNTMAAGFDPESNREYRKYREMGDEIRAALLQVMETARGGGTVQTAPMQQEAPMQQQETFAPAPAAAGPWTCPACGGQNDGKFCEYCGAPRG